MNAPVICYIPDMPPAELSGIQPSDPSLLTILKMNFLDLPSCVNINSPAYSGGFLGAAHDPFIVKNPMMPVEDISYPAQMDTHRFRERLKMLRSH